MSTRRRGRRSLVLVPVFTTLLGLSMVVTGGAAVTPPAAAAAARPVDHFLCYSASAARGFAPSVTQLTNQFGAFAPTFGAVDLHCNPVQKAVGKRVTKVTNANANLLCWSITPSTAGPTPPSFIARVSNQFGTATLRTGAPTQLCAPSWKSAKRIPHNRPVQPPGLSHFTCYAASYVKGTAPFRPPRSVVLSDQFGTRAVKVGSPQLLCLPTDKQVGSVHSPVVNSVTHLVCFAVSQTPRKSPVYDQNQFGAGMVQILNPPPPTIGRMLCVPSTKTVLQATPILTNVFFFTPPGATRESAGEQVTLAGDAVGGPPAGTVTFYLCPLSPGAVRPTSICTGTSSPDVVYAATAEVEHGSFNTSIASLPDILLGGMFTVTDQNNAWVCVRAVYNPASYYRSVSGTDPASQCFAVTD